MTLPRPRHRRHLGRILAAVLSIVCCARPAAAHDRTISYSTWDLRGREARVTVRLSALDVSRFPEAMEGAPDFTRAFGAHLAARLTARAGGAACPASEPRRLDVSPEWVVYEWSLSCPAVGALEIRSDLLYDLAPTHLHFARLRRDGGPMVERVFSESNRSWSLPEGAPAGARPAGTTLLDYLALGVEHILSGYDHLAFLLALLLIGGTIGEVAGVVTGFTVAHSITLGVAVAGWLRPERAPIEALIGLSIAMVSAENVWLVGARGRGLPVVIAVVLGLLATLSAAGRLHVPALTLLGLAGFSLSYFALLARVERPGRLRWGVAFLFGLVHGFGFAAALVDADLDRSRLVQALFGFNAGVEAGQLAVVALLWPVLRLLSTEPRRHLATVELGSAAVFALGVYWFVARAFG